MTTYDEALAALKARGVPHDPLNEFELAVADVLQAEWDAELARIGRLLCDRGHDLWREVYRIHCEIYDYTAGGEVLWLLERAPEPAS